MEDNEMDFQRATLVRLLQDESFFFEVMSNGALQPDLFTGAFSDIAGQMLALFEQTNRWPNGKMVEAELLLNKAQGSSFGDTVLNVFEELRHQEPLPISLTQLTKFLTRKRIQHTVFTAARECAKDGWDVEEIAEQLMDAGQTMFVMPENLVMDAAHLDDPENEMERDTITTGIPEVDDVLNGGLGRKEIMCIAAPTGIGKTHAGCQMTARAAEVCKAKELVIHVTCEVTRWVIAARLDSVWSGLTINEVPFNKPAVAAAVRAKIVEPPLILEFASGDATIAAISSVVKLKQAQGYDVRLVVVDYDEEMKQSGNNDNLRHSLGQIYRQFKKAAHDLNFAGVMISQTNGTGAREKIVREFHVAESFTKSKIVEVMLTISSEYWLYIAKNRTGGPSHIAFPCTVDTNHSRVEVTGDSMTLFEAIELSDGARTNMEQDRMISGLNKQ